MLSNQIQICNCMSQQKKRHPVMVAEVSKSNYFRGEKLDHFISLVSMLNMQIKEQIYALVNSINKMMER